MGKPKCISISAQKNGLDMFAHYKINHITICPFKKCKKKFNYYMF